MGNISRSIELSGRKEGGRERERERKDCRQRERESLWYTVMYDEKISDGYEIYFFFTV
jgi:hypothetical protein